MEGTKLRPRDARLWELVAAQHGVVSRAQLLAEGMTRKAIAHRIQIGRLHPLWRGVYAVGRPDVGPDGRRMAAVLSCGPAALLSHRSAAALWGLLADRAGLEVVVPGDVLRRRPGIRVHRRVGLAGEERRTLRGIPVTDPVTTLVDVASSAPQAVLERALNEADRLDLVDPERLRVELDGLSRRPGLGPIRALLDRHDVVDTGLERRFLAIVRSARLPEPKTQVHLGGYRVDFHWPQLGLVVETDGLRYHRTALQQADDRRRDHAHAMAGLRTLRFAEAQVRDEPRRVRATLEAVIGQLASVR